MELLSVGLVVVLGNILGHCLYDLYKKIKLKRICRRFQKRADEANQSLSDLRDNLDRLTVAPFGICPVHRCSIPMNDCCPQCIKLDKGDQ